MSVEMLSSMDIIDRIRNKNSGNSPTGKKVFPKYPLMKVIDSIDNPQTKAAMLDFFTKELKSPDLFDVRITSMDPRARVLRNEATVFSNILELNPVFRTRDLQIQFRERRIGSDVAQMFNPNDALPGEAQSDRALRTNTLGFLGNVLKVRWLAQELGEQSEISAEDPRALEVDDELVRIRRTRNSKLLSNTEVTAETAGFVPQPGGFLTRSTLYNVAAAGDLTNALIQGRVNAIANRTSPEAYGDVPLIALSGSASQLGVVEDLMVARYPGESSVDWGQTTAALRRRVASVNVPEEMTAVYRPRPGMPVLFVHEPQLASDTVLFFDPAQPQLARFQMMGQFGPWVVERPTENILYMLLAFDAFSLLDHIIESRAVITGLNS